MNTLGEACSQSGLVSIPELGLETYPLRDHHSCTCKPRRPLSREMALSRSRTDFAIALDSFTPSNVLRDEVLLASVHRFFRRGTADECFRLLPEEFRSDKPSKRINSLRTPVPATPQPHQSRDTLISAERYFRTLVPDKGNRFKRLVKVAQRITEFRIQESVDPGRVYDEDSIVETPIIRTGAVVGPGSISEEDLILKSSIARAEAIFEKISSKQDTKAYRYNLLYFSNAVDQYESLQLAVSQGRGNKSIAFDKISRGDQKKREIAKRTYADASRYLRCSEIGGPGSLLSITAAKFEMENLNNEDIQLLCNYRKAHPSIEKQSRSLDFTVVNELVKGLLAQGIESVDITKGLTRLTKLLCRYVDTKSLTEDGKVLPKLVTADSNEYHNGASQSPVGLEPISHALQSQQTYHAAEPHTNIAKRRRMSGNERPQLPTICSVLTPENDRSIAQAEGQESSMDTLIYSEQQHNTVPPCEQVSNIEQGRASITSLVEAQGELVPILVEMEVGQ